MVTIEPIKNQYLTALKERQHIIDKLNEIISGLNALNFDDLTTIQAELVSIRESLQTQNTAITEINNSIGQIESELTSFDNRLITLNRNIENTESHLTSFENDTALNLQSKVNKNGDTMTGNLGIPTSTTGARDSFAVNGTRLQNDLDNYSQMVRITGNQAPILGIKKSAFIVNNPVHIDTFATSNTGWHELYTFPLLSGRWIGKLTGGTVSNIGIGARTSFIEIFINLDGNGTQDLKILNKKGSYAIDEKVKLCVDSTGYHILCDCTPYIRHGFNLTSLVYGWKTEETNYFVNPNAINVVDPPEGRYDKIISCTTW